MSKAENLTFPSSDGVANTEVRYYDCLATQASLLPATWYGKFVIITNDSANPAQFYLSTLSSATVQTAPTAATTGSPAATLGTTLLANTSRHGRLPFPKMNVATGQPFGIYLVRGSAAAATLKVELAEQ